MLGVLSHWFLLSALCQGRFGISSEVISGLSFNQANQSRKLVETPSASGAHVLYLESLVSTPATGKFGLIPIYLPSSLV